LQAYGRSIIQPLSLFKKQAKSLYVTVRLNALFAISRELLLIDSLPSCSSFAIVPICLLLDSLRQDSRGPDVCQFISEFVRKLFSLFYLFVKPVINVCPESSNCEAICLLTE
jgi:hypothetical protein